MMSVKFVKKVANRLKREFLHLPVVTNVDRLLYNSALGDHSTKLPWLQLEDTKWVDILRSEGASVIDLNDLNLPLNRDLLQQGTEAVELLRNVPANGQNAVRLPLEDLIKFPAIYLWGLQERVLDIVENYIGLPVMYHGADLRREIPDGRTTDVRQWHIDAEDKRMVKFIVYMNDVDVDGGPFQYVDKEETLKAARSLGYRYGFVTDKKMDSVIPQSEWRAATGGQLTAAFADTCGVFHRATPPVKRDRYSITFSFSSRVPVKTYDTVIFTEEQLKPILTNITARQRAVLPPVYQN